MDGNRFPVAHVYFESEPGRRAAANLMTRDEARKIAAGIAKLPELLRAKIESPVVPPKRASACALRRRRASVSRASSRPWRLRWCK